MEVNFVMRVYILYASEKGVSVMAILKVTSKYFKIMTIFVRSYMNSSLKLKLRDWNVKILAD